MRNAPFLLAALLSLAGCGKPTALAVDGGWVRLPAVPGRPGAAYFALHGGAADATLIAVATPEARHAELHESMAGGMKGLPAVSVAAGASVTFAPGGRHVMLFDLDPKLAPGGTVKLTLSFADGRRLTTDAAIVGAADPAPRQAGL